jgi:chromosome segregation ATPase
MPSKIALPGSSMDTAGGDTLLRKSASLGIEVDRDRVDSVASRAETVVARLGGSTERSSRLPDESAALDFRVPAENLEEVLDALAALGNPTRRSSQIEDVTTQSSDLAAQIENLRGLRDRLRALLARAEKVEEILQIERELNRVQTQLDVYERQQERLLTDVAMSTVSLHVQPIDPPRILGPLGYLGVGLWWVVEKLFVLRY